MSKQIDLEKYSKILKALGHPVRLKLAVGLIDNECNVKKIVSELGLPQSTVSQHLAILTSRGIISPRKEGVQTCYSVVNQKVLDIIEVLKK